MRNALGKSLFGVALMVAATACRSEVKPPPVPPASAEECQLFYDSFEATRSSWLRKKARPGSRGGRASGVSGRFLLYVWLDARPH
jgi:hypothetical protein